MKIANNFIGYRTPVYKEGNNCIDGITDLLKEKNHKKPLIVTDNSLVKLHLLDRLFKQLDDNGIEYTLFDDVRPNPTSDDVLRGYEVLKREQNDCIIAFGGGSPMDLAKGIAAKDKKPKKDISQLQGLLKVGKVKLDIIAIPTTAGTGSETTVAAVITDSSTHHKRSINDPGILPKYAFLDPQLTINLPKSITSTTGMDALTHAVESYLNHTYNTKVEDELALKAIKLIYDNIYKVYEDGGDIKARENMLLASFYAGRSFTRGCVGYVHAIGHTLGGLYNTPHGLAMAIILPHVLREYKDKVYKRLSKIAMYCSISGNSDEDRAEKFISWIEETSEKMNIPNRLSMVKEEDLKAIATLADKEANPLYPVPVLWDKEQIEDVVRKML